MPASERNLSIRNLVVFCVLSLLCTMGPYVLGWLWAPEGTVFTGVLANHNDFTAYLAAIRQGAEGNWLFHFNFSPEEWQPALMLPLYMVTGKWLTLLSTNYLLAFHVLRLLALILCWWGVLYWLRTIFPEQQKIQLTTWLLIIFGGGLGWLVWSLLSWLGMPIAPPPDLAGSEWITTLIAVNAPHYLIGFGLEAILFASFLKMVKAENGLKWAIVTMLIALSLGLIYVYNTAVVGLVMGVYLLGIAVREKRIPWRLWIYGGMVVVPLVPLLFYYGYWVNRDPAWATYVQSDLNIIPPPSVWQMLIGMGLLAVFAVAGLPAFIRQKREPLVWIWLVANLVVMYVPIVPYSGRFMLGLLIPIGTLAGFGLETVVLPRLQQTAFYDYLQRTDPKPQASLRRMLLILTMPSTLMVVLGLVQAVILNVESPAYYMLASERKAAQWLADHTTDDDLILSDYPMGNYLPSISNTRVFFGQFFLTLHFEEKQADVFQFWDAGTTPEWRKELIDRWGITYIYEGRYERGLAAGETPPIGNVVYDEEGVTIYQVMPATEP